MWFAVLGEQKLALFCVAASPQNRKPHIFSPERFCCKECHTISVFTLILASRVLIVFKGHFPLCFEADLVMRLGLILARLLSF